MNAHAKELGVDAEVLLEFGHFPVSSCGAWPARFCIKGKSVNLYFVDGKIERDAFGRYLAYVYVDGRDIVEWMLEEGLVWTRSEPHPKTGTYESLNRQAQSLRLGVYRLKMR